MPQLPEFNEGRNFDPTPPPGVDVNPSSFGRGMDAAANLAGTIANIGADLVDKRKRAADSNAAFNAHISDINDAAIFEEQLKLKTPPNGEGLAENMRNWADARFQQNQKDMPSEEARLLYKNASMPFFEKAVTDSLGKQSLMRVAAYKSDIKAASNRSASLLVQIPSLEYATEAINAQKEQVRKNVGVLFSASEGKLMEEEIGITNSVGILDGYFERGKNDAINGRSWYKQGLDLLQGNAKKAPVIGLKSNDPNAMDSGGMEVGGYNRLLDDLPAHVRAQYMEKFATALKERQNTDGAELNRRLRDDISQQLHGDKMDATLPDALNTAVNEKWPGFTPESRVRHWHEHNLAFATSEVVNQMRKTSPDKWDGLAFGWGKRVDRINAAMAEKDPTLEAIRQNGFNRSTRDEYEGMLQRAKVAIENERNKDAADYVFREFPFIANRLAGAKTPQESEAAVGLVLQKQQELGIPIQFQRPISRSQAIELARGVNSDDYAQTSAAITAIEQKFGNQWGPIYNQLSADGALKAGRDALGLIAYVPDPQQRENLVSSVIYSKDINKAYNQKFQKAEQIGHDALIRQAVEPIVGGMAAVSEEGGGLAAANAMRDAVQKEFEKKMVQPNPPAPSDAVNQAVKVIKTNHEFVEDAGSVVMVPKQIGKTVIDSRIVGGFIKSHKAPDALKSLGVAVPAAMSNDLAYNKADPAEKERLYLRHVENFGYWAGTPQNNAITLRVHNPDGSWATVVGKDGKPIVVPFEKAATMDEFTRKQMQPGAVRRAVEAVIGGAIDRAVENKTPDPTGIDPNLMN